MTASATPNQILSMNHRHIHWVCWLSFALFNNFILTILLLVFWYFGIDSNLFRKFLQSLFFHQAWQILSAIYSLLGLSAFALYALAWRKIYMKALMPYLFKNIKEQKIV
jgi:hypothetical protein